MFVEDLFPVMAGRGEHEVFPSKIENSVTLAGAEYFSRAFGAGNQKQWSWHGRIKRHGFEGHQSLLNCDVDGTNWACLEFNEAGHLRFVAKVAGVTVCSIETDGKIVDPTGHSSLEFFLDTTQAVELDRIRIKFNGKIMPYTVYTSCAKDAVTVINSAAEHTIGNRVLSSRYLHATISDVYFVDGLLPDGQSYTQQSALVTGLSAPQKLDTALSGNSTHFEFSNALDLGADSSGLGNNWTVHGSPVQTLDTPTNNYCTLNPLHWVQGSGGVLSAGNLAFSAAVGTALTGYVGTYRLDPTSEWRWEYTLTTAGQERVGFTDENLNYNWYDIRPSGGDIYQRGIIVQTVTPCLVGDVIGMVYKDGAVQFYRNGIPNGTPVTTLGEPLYPYVISTNPTMASAGVANFGATGFAHSYPAGLPICMESFPDPAIMKSSEVADLVTRVGKTDQNLCLNRPVTFNDSMNWSGTEVNVVDGNTGTYAAHTQYPAVGCYYQIALAESTTIRKIGIDHIDGGGGTGGVVSTLRVFVSPDGIDWSNYKDFSIDRNNEYQERIFTTPMIGQHIRYYNAAQHGGVNWLVTELTAFEGIPPTVSLPDMEGGPDIVIDKCRSNAIDWAVFDTVRGANNRLEFNTTDTEAFNASSLPAFNEDGYTAGDLINGGGRTFLDLCLKAGPEQGVEIVKYTGDGVAGRQIAHNLGKAPTFMIVKRISSTGEWAIYHTVLSATHRLLFTSAATTTDAGAWNNTEPTTTNFTVGNSTLVNAAGSQYIAYLFTDSDIFKAFSYTGNGNVDGPFVNLGGKPLSIPFLKDTSATWSWQNRDAVRCPFNPVDAILRPDLPDIEVVAANLNCNFTSQGFKVAGTNSGLNAIGDTYVGLAILESTKYSNAF